MKSTAPRCRQHTAALCLGLLLGAGAMGTLCAQTFSLTLNKPAADIWEYPFASDPGGNLLGPTFGAVGNGNFDNRDGQFYMRFDTGGTVPTGLDPSRYQIVSIKLTLAVNSGSNSNGTGKKIYDGTYDPVNTFGPGGAPINGDDPGRPMELYGAGYRNGVTSTTLSENTPFSTIDQPDPRTRSVYATDFKGSAAAGSLNGGSRDVSNSVTDNFDTVPFAIGQVAASDLDGAVLKEDANIVFTLNVLNADLLRYLQLSLAEGRIGLIASSLEQASQGGPVVYPDYYTKENTLGASPKLEIVVNVVPEPGTSALLLAGAFLFSSTRRRRCARPSS